MKVTAILMVLIALLAGWFAWSWQPNNQGYLNQRCTTKMRYVDADTADPFLFDGVVVFEFERKKTGHFSIYGTTEYLGGKYIFSRYAEFAYTNLSANKYNFKVTGISPMGHDNTPDGVAAHAEKILGMSSEYSLYLNKVNDNYISISSNLSTLMHCVILS